MKVINPKIKKGFYKVSKEALEKSEKKLTMMRAENIHSALKTFK